MTNGEKYKTTQERIREFRAYCKKMHDRHGGSCCKQESCSICSLKWLELEAEEEKPLPCPFCGGETVVRSNWNSTHQVVCNSQGCWYCSKCETTSADAIAAHNRVAKKQMEVSK